MTSAVGMLQIQPVCLQVRFILRCEIQALLALVGSERNPSIVDIN